MWIRFSKADGSYIGQWAPGPRQQQMDDVRGMYVIPGKTTGKKKKVRQPDTLVWITPEGIFSSLLAME